MWKIGLESNFKTFTRLLMHVAIATVFVPSAFKKGSTNSEKKEYWKAKD